MPASIVGYQGLLDQGEQAWKINRLGKHVPGTGCSCFLVQVAAALSGDEHRHHRWLQPLEVPAKGQAIHAWHPQVQ